MVQPLALVPLVVGLPTQTLASDQAPAEVRAQSLSVALLFRIPLLWPFIDSLRFAVQKHLSRTFEYHTRLGVLKSLPGPLAGWTTTKNPAPLDRELFFPWTYYIFIFLFIGLGILDLGY